MKVKQCFCRTNCHVLLREIGVTFALSIQYFDEVILWNLQANVLQERLSG
jgi:hypothetical protein